MPTIYRHLDCFRTADDTDGADKRDGVSEDRFATLTLATPLTAAAGALTPKLAPTRRRRALLPMESGGDERSPLLWSLRKMPGVRHQTNCYRSVAIRTTSLRFKYGNIPHGFCLPRIIKDVIIYAYGNDVQSVEKVLP